jgi:MarR family 2-MHQ and catechol resistance regulon transcriptional repressor
MPTRYRGTPGEVRALNAYIRLARAAATLAARLERHLARQGLTGSQFGVLDMLFHLGRLPLREVARKLFRSPSDVTTVVDRLERRRLVRRARDRSDRRRVTVSLTRRGRQVTRRVLPAHVAAIVRALSPLAPGEQATLGRLARRLGLGRPARRRR